ncbi:MAG: 5,10-methylenetetrahydrofolate reductase [Campylobacteraceae bacterium]|nr:5,10-methylenetetrahydrofolate reductase [Campylobacteraceae bacterium]
MLYKLLDNNEFNILLYGLTPPKVTHTKEDILAISQRQIDRLKGAPIDGIVMYDLQDEAERTALKRPFPFLETIDPTEYVDRYLKSLQKPAIIYRAIGKYSHEETELWLINRNSTDSISVFVGAASKNQKVQMSIKDAYVLCKKVAPNMKLGGIAIAERHSQKNDEDFRVIDKMKQGCSFFITQAVYDFNSAKKFLKDYAKRVEETKANAAPIIFTLTPCGSEKTLDFMKWLGIEIPSDIEIALKEAPCMLQASVGHILEVYYRLYALGKELNIPIGCNVESVAIRKAEIEASIEMIYALRGFMTNS